MIHFVLCSIINNSLCQLDMMKSINILLLIVFFQWNHEEKDENTKHKILQEYLNKQSIYAISFTSNRLVDAWIHCFFLWVFLYMKANLRYFKFLRDIFCRNSKIFSCLCVPKRRVKTVKFLYYNLKRHSFIFSWVKIW